MNSQQPLLKIQKRFFLTMGNDFFTTTEIIGYLASLLLMLSFLMKKVRTLRWVNSLGCLVFVIYGFMLDTSWPVIVTNAFILGTNIYYLYFRKKTNIV